MRYLFALLLTLSFGQLAWSATIDFRNPEFASTFGPNTTSETVSGVNFDFVAIARGADGFRQNSSGLRFGVPGNGMYSLSIVADQDLIFTNITGRGHTLTSYAGQLPFDFLVDGELKVDDLMFSPGVMSTLALGNIFVAAGESFLIDVDFSALQGSSVYASAILQSLDFEVSAVPLPAAVWLFASALMALGFFGRQTSTRSSKTTT